MTWQPIETAPKDADKASPVIDPPRKERIRRAPDPDWLSVRDVASRLSVDKRQVRKWMDLGQFDEIVVLGPRSTRISYASYLRFVEKLRAA